MDSMWIVEWSLLTGSSLLNFSTLLLAASMGRALTTLELVVIPASFLIRNVRRDDEHAALFLREHEE